MFFIGRKKKSVDPDELKYFKDESEIQLILADEIIASLQDPEIKVVSFDIFDTLLIRPALVPVEVLRLLRIGGYSGKESARMRWYADIRCYGTMGPKATLEDIYSELGRTFGIPEDVIGEAYASELELERDTLRPNDPAKRIFDEAKRLGKKVIIISDTYFTTQFLEDVLQRCGYTGYDRLYCSTETLLRKDSGDVFDPVCKELDVLPENILHIGDNMYSDFNGPVSHGWRAYILMRPSMLFGRTLMGRYMDYIEPKSDNRILWGMYANLSMSKGMNGKVLDSAYGFGLFLGPMMLGFVKWMISRMRFNGHRHLLLCYRDGFLIEKMLDIMSEGTELGFDYDEIHLPRILRHAFYSRNKGLFGSLEEMGSNQDMTVSDFIRYRLYAEDPGTAERALEVFRSARYSDGNDPIGPSDRLYPILPQLDAVFRESCGRVMEDVERYCRSKASADGTALFDIGYRGSILEFLEKEIGICSFEYQMMGNAGLYLREFSGNLETYYGYTRKIQMEASAMEMLIENVISSQEPELLDVHTDDSGRAEYVFGEEVPPSPCIEDVQRGILDYVRYAADILGGRVMDLALDHGFEFSVLEDLLSSHDTDMERIVRDLRRPDSSQICGTPSVGKE